jgi:hypothetical protein
VVGEITQPKNFVLAIYCISEGEALRANSFFLGSNIEKEYQAALN